MATAVRDLVEIGQPSVPPLIEELDRLTENLPLRSLGFTLRAIGDPRAVPALIRAIPRTLVKPAATTAGSGRALGTSPNSCGSTTWTRATGPLALASACRSVRSPGLYAITGQRFNEEELNFINLEGGPKRQLQRRLFHRLAERWAGWWEENWRGSRTTRPMPR